MTKRYAAGGRVSRSQPGPPGLIGAQPGFPGVRAGTSCPYPLREGDQFIFKDGHEIIIVDDDAEFVYAKDAERWKQSAADYRAGRLRTYSLEEVERELGLDDND